jgi:hypothetical protein
MLIHLARRHVSGLHFLHRLKHRFDALLAAAG